MRWLLFFVAVSASADCSSRLLYTTPDYIVTAQLDDGALYEQLLLGDDVERIDLATGDRSVVAMGPIGGWTEQHGVFGTPTFLLAGGEAVFVKTAPPPPEQAVTLLTALRSLSESMPYTRELKKPRPPQRDT